MHSFLSIFPAFSEITDVRVSISTEVNSLHIWNIGFTSHFQENCSNDPVTAFHLFVSSRRNWEGMALRSPLFQASNYSSDNGMASVLTDVSSVTCSTVHYTASPCNPFLRRIFLYVKQANLWIIPLFTAGRKHTFNVLDLVFMIWMLLSCKSSVFFIDQETPDACCPYISRSIAADHFHSHLLQCPQLIYTLLR